MAKVIRISVLILSMAFFSFRSIDALDNAKPGNSAEPLKIVAITPSGEDVPAGRQITFQFNRPVVPLGRMDRDASEIPIVITPEVKGQWRWLNRATLALLLDDSSALHPATRYEIIVNPGIRDEDGVTLHVPLVHTFITQRPTVTDVWFKLWESPDMPVMRTYFNQPVSKESVEQYLFMGIKGKGQSRFLISVRPDPDYEKRQLWRNKRNRSQTIQNQGQSEMKPESSPLLNSVEYRTEWLVSPKNQLPPDTDIELNIEPGLKSVFGKEGGKENRGIYSFRTFPAFTFLGIECWDRRNNRIIVEPYKSSDVNSRCSPPISLAFSSPVLSSDIMKSIKIEPELSLDPLYSTDMIDDEIYSLYNKPHQLGKKYYVRFGNMFDAYTSYRIVSEPNKIKDAFGRILEKPIDIRFTTDHFPPYFTVDNFSSVLEKNSDSELPVTVTNLDELEMTYDRLTAKSKESALKFKISIPKANDLTVEIPAQIRKMLNGQSGVIQGKIVRSTPEIEKNRWEQRSFFSQATPFHVHVKTGYYNTVVWVTDMTTGEPVSDVKVKIYKDKSEIVKDFQIGLSSNPEVLSEGVTDSFGTVVLAGAEQLDPEKKLVEGHGREEALIIRVDKDEDIALLPMRDVFAVDTRYRSAFYGHIGTWGVTSQGIYRPGDTIQYKIYVRYLSNETFTAAPKEAYELSLIDSTNKVVFEVKDIKLSDFGAIEGEFSLSDTATAGWYRFKVKPSYLKWSIPAIEVLISDFTATSFNVTADINGQYFHAGDELKITTKAKYHDEGSYGNSPARASVVLRKKDADDFFAFKDKPLSGFYFGDLDNPSSMGDNSEQVLAQSKGMLNKEGEFIARLDLPDSNILFGELMIESAVRDDRGKYVVGRATAKYSSRDLFVGIKSNKKPLHNNVKDTNEGLVVDITGKPVSGIPVCFTIEHNEKILGRENGDSDSTLTRYTEKWTEEETYNMVSSNQPFKFGFWPAKPGRYRITAHITDSKGRKHSTRIYGDSRNRDSEKEDYTDTSLDITADRPEYKIGDTARYVVKNSFPGSKALVTVEHHGVIKHWVQTLETEAPVIEVKVERDFIPEYFLSVVVVSPRTDKPLIKSKLDQGKPAFRMGYIKSVINDPYKELIVEAKPEKETYKPGDKVKVDLNVTQRHGPKNEPFELAVVVLNEEILALLSKGKGYFDPYEGFYYDDYFMGYHEVYNYNLLQNLLGRRVFQKLNKVLDMGITKNLFASAFNLNEAEPSKYEEKALDLRSNFKSVCYWNPSIITDNEGKATIEFVAPDNLTGWRVFAIAVTPTDQMGLGEGRFAVSRSTEIRPVMPNQVMESDSFKAGFSIMNRTDKTRELSMIISADGAIETGGNRDGARITQAVTAEPYKRTIVWLPIKTKGSGKIRFTAKGGDADDWDGVVHELEVRKMVSLETVAAYGASVGDTITEPLQFPDRIRTDAGSVKVSLSPSVIGNVESAFSYLRDYPYACWEQLLTKAVMASHYQSLKQYMPEDFRWEGSEALAQAVLNKATTHQAPNGGMAYYTPQDRYADPYLSAYTALAFTWLAERRYQIPSEAREKLNGYLLTMLETDEIPDFYSEGMVSTVRAVALAALAKQGKTGIEELNRHYPHVKEMDLFGKAHFLIAAIGVKGTEGMRKEIFNMILAQADQKSGKYAYNEVVEDGYSRILASPTRTSAAILTSFVAYARTEEGKKRVGDIPFKMVRHITQTRKPSGRWENTQENIFCMNALVEYSKAYENERPDMAIKAKLGAVRMGEAEFKDVRDVPVEFTRPIRSEDPGRKTEVTIEREGAGRLYYSAGITYAPLKLYAQPVNAGMDIKREYSVKRNGEWILLRNPMEIKRGELVRVDLFVSLPSAGNFVVVDDPVPGGLEPVNSDLATSSMVDADKGEYKPAGGSWWFHHGDWSRYGTSRWSFYHKELRHHAARFYSEYLPAGNYRLSYAAQAIAPGEFTVMPAHAEEMYDPEVFGKSSAAVLNVEMEDEK